MYAELEKIAVTVYERLKRYGLKGRTITLKIKYSDFRQITRNQSFPFPVGDFDKILETAKQLLLATEPEDKPVRLLGISLSNFGEVIPVAGRSGNTAQLSLFDEEDLA